MSPPIRIEPSNEAGRKLTPLIPFILYAIAAVFILVAVVVVIAGRSAAADAKLLAAEGVAAQATVTNRTITETRSRDRDDRLKTTTTFRVTLTFVTRKEEEISVERGVDRARFDSLADGQVVQVYYLPARPTLVGFEKGDGTAGLGFLWVFAAIFGLVGLGIGWLGVRLRRAIAAAA